MKATSMSLTIVGGVVVMFSRAIGTNNIGAMVAVGVIAGLILGAIGTVLLIKHGRSISVANGKGKTDDQTYRMLSTLSSNVGYYAFMLGFGASINHNSSINAGLIRDDSPNPGVGLVLFGILAISAGIFFRALRVRKKESIKPGSADELIKYKELLDSGAISLDEFNAKKNELLK